MKLDQKQLERAFKKYGLHYRFEPGFAKRGHDFSAVTIKGVISHHTAGPRKGNYPSMVTVKFGRPGLKGPLSQLGLARDGTVIGIAAGLSYHAGPGSYKGLTRGNTYLIGIEAESTGRGDWTPSQLSAYPRLLAALRDLYNLPSDMVMAHYEWAVPRGRKIDVFGWPGKMSGLRSQANKIYNHMHAAAKPAQPPVKKPTTPTKVKYRLLKKLVVDGKFGERTVKALQKALRVRIDGDYGVRTKVALQKRLGVKADGVIGPVTVRALNRVLLTNSGPVWTVSTTAALQRRLNAGTF